MPDGYTSDDTLWCEQCGETPQAVSLKHAGLCEDCAAVTLSEALEPVLGFKPCGEILHFMSTNTKAICIAVHGAEHDHSAIDYCRPGRRPSKIDMPHDFEENFGDHAQGAN